MPENENLTALNEGSVIPKSIQDQQKNNQQPSTQQTPQQPIKQDK